jgi:hypothetical protein
VVYIDAHQYGRVTLPYAFHSDHNPTQTIDSCLADPVRPERSSARFAGISALTESAWGPRNQIEAGRTHPWHGLSNLHHPP